MPDIPRVPGRRLARDTIALIERELVVHHPDDPVPPATLAAADRLLHRGARILDARSAISLRFPPSPQSVVPARDAVVALFHLLDAIAPRLSRQVVLPHNPP